MKERSYIELLSKRLQARGFVEAASTAGTSDLHIARSSSGERLLGDRYLPTNRIGRGRLGEIYEALDAAGRDVGIERHVALQRIDDRVVAEKRGVAELESGYARLRAGAHPNVVKTLDFFRDGHAVYVVTELLDGLSLRAVLDDAAPEALSFDETASILRAVGDGLQYLHAKSILHGDLRPENVFVTFDYVVKLLDAAPISSPAGVPYAVEDAEPATQSRDVRDDVYGLACLAYELLSGRHPFNASSPHDAHRAGLTPAPLADLTVRQWQAMAGGLALLRAQRTPSVAQFLSELGISGTERLHTADDGAHAPRSQEEVVPLHAAAAAPATLPSTARGYATPARGRERTPATHAGRLRQARRRTGSARFRSLLLLAALAGGGAWVFWNYDALLARASQLVASEGASETPQASASSARTGTEAEPRAAGLPADPARLATEAFAPADAAESNPVPIADAAPPVEAESTPEAVEPSRAIAVQDAPAQPAPEPTLAEPLDPPAATPRGPAFRFAQSVLVVREGQAAAAVVIERSAVGAPATIVWWTSDDTAAADEDYADLGQRTERFSADERSRTIYVPLVADAVPERTESFHVYLGRYDARRSHLEASASARVDIRDDD